MKVGDLIRLKYRTNMVPQTEKTMLIIKIHEDIKSPFNDSVVEMFSSDARARLVKGYLSNIKINYEVISESR